MTLIDCCMVFVTHNNAPDLQQEQTIVASLLHGISQCAAAAADADAAHCSCY